MIPEQMKSCSLSENHIYTIKHQGATIYTQLSKIMKSNHRHKKQMHGYQTGKGEGAGDKSGVWN